MVVCNFIKVFIFITKPWGDQVYQFQFSISQLDLDHVLMLRNSLHTIIIFAIRDKNGER